MIFHSSRVESCNGSTQVKPSLVNTFSQVKSIVLCEENSIHLAQTTFPGILEF